MKRKTGYYVWIFGDKFWHRILDRAWKRTQKAQKYASGFIHIVRCSDKKHIWGWDGWR